MFVSGVPKKYVLDSEKIVDFIANKRQRGEALSLFDECALRLVEDQDIAEGVDMRAFIPYLYENGFDKYRNAVQFDFKGTRIEYGVLFASIVHLEMIIGEFCEWRAGLGGFWGVLRLIRDGILSYLVSLYPLRKKSQ